MADSITDVETQQHYDDFFQDIFLEMENKYGEVEEMNVCDNLGDHLVRRREVNLRGDRRVDASRSTDVTFRHCQ